MNARLWHRVHSTLAKTITQNILYSPHLRADNPFHAIYQARLSSRRPYRPLDGSIARAGRRRIAPPAAPDPARRRSGDRCRFAPRRRGTPFGLPVGWWVVGIGDTQIGEFVVVDTFDNSKVPAPGASATRTPSSASTENACTSTSATYTRLHMAEASR